MDYTNQFQQIYDIAVECRNYITFFVVFAFVVFIIWLVFKLVNHLSIYF